MSSFSPFPGWEEKTIHNSCLPDIVISSGGELPCVACKDSDIVRQIVIEAKVGSLRIRWRQAVAGDGVQAKSLLDAEDRLKTADYAVEASECTCPVVGLNPIALGMLAMSELRAQPECCILGLPPDVGAKEIFVSSLQKTVERESRFKTLLRQVEADSSAIAAMRGKLLGCAAG